MALHDEELNMEDPVLAVATQLTSAWTAANTDSLTPTIGPIYNYKRVDVGIGGDYALTVPVSHSERPASIGYSYIDYTDVVSIDLRTGVSRAHLIKMRDEARRCVYAAKTTLGGYKFCKIVAVHDASDKMRNLWRMIVDVELRKLDESVPA